MTNRQFTDLPFRNEFEGKVALVTGATSGIGKAAAIAFASTGAMTIVSGRRKKAGLAVVDLIREKGGNAIFVAADVVNEQEIENLVREAVSEYGRLDMAFNNAGIEGRSAPIEELDLEAYDSVMNINARGVFFSMKHQIRQMKLQGSGVIVNCASAAAHIGLPNAALYVASKHAVAGMTKAAALETAAQGIRINAISPGGVDTPLLERWLNGVDRSTAASFVPMQRTGEPEEIANAVLWLCSSATSFMTGQVIRVDGGVTTH